jgi:hypothetical protein
MKKSFYCLTVVCGAIATLTLANSGNAIPSFTSTLIADFLIADLIADQHSHTAPATPSNAPHSMPSHSDMEVEMHEHGMIEIPADQPIPSITVMVHPDAMRGWNLEAQVENFRFAPEHVNHSSDLLQEGHAHLYINGEKITRLYSNWYYLGNLPPGTHEITVSLNTNTHQTLMHDGEAIAATFILEVGE